MLQHQLIRRVAILGVVALAAGLGCTVNPVTGEQQLDLLGEQQEIALGEQLYPKYTQSSLGPVADPQLQTYVQEVGGWLASRSHRPRLRYEFNAVNDPMVNAYALPGGKISVTRGLVARMESEDEMAAVLGHEIGHVTARHAAQQYTRQILTQLVLIGGMAYMEAEQTEHRDLYALGGLLGAQLMLASYSREQERQSDELGVEYMVSAGYNPQGMVDLLQTLQDGHDREPSLLEKWFSTHPMTTNRIAAARERVAALGAEVTGRPVTVEPYLQTADHVRASRDAYDRLAEARQLLAKGSAAAARQQLEPAVSRWPEDGLLRAFYAAALLESGDRRRGLDNAARAADDAPDIFHPQLVAGEGLLEAKRFSAAVPHLERASSLLPDIPAVELLRAQALEGAGRRDEAVAAYRHVVQLDPSGESGQRAQQRLRALGAAQPAAAS